MFREITIRAVLNGWIVQCGCQTVVYQERNQLVSDLDAYLKDPKATEERFLKASVNHQHLGGIAGVLGGTRAVGQPNDAAYQASTSQAPPESFNQVSARIDRG